MRKDDLLTLVEVEGVSHIRHLSSGVFLCGRKDKRHEGKQYFWEAGDLALPECQSEISVIEGVYFCPACLKQIKF